MGIFDMFRPGSASPLDPRDALIRAVAQGDTAALAALCRKHAKEISASFPGWRTVPPEVRQDRGALDRYMEMMIAVATHFARQGDPSLIDALQGGAEDNPLPAWKEDLLRARSLLEEGKEVEAVAVLRATLEKAGGLQGSAVDDLLPKTYGLLGVACFRAGDVAAAIEHTQRAKTLCERVGDREGAAIYANNLRGLQEGDAEADTTVVFRAPDGRTLTREDLRGHAGRVQWEVRRGSPVPQNASELHHRGREAGARGEHDAALDFFSRAHQAAPDWPYPLYDAAFTHLLRGDAEQALRRYAEVDRLCPRGFFTAKTAVHTLRRETTGDLPAGTYLKYVRLENPRNAPARRQLTLALTREVPTFAPAWLALSQLTEDEGERLATLERGLSSAPDPETLGMLSINRALLIARQGRLEEAVDILGLLALDPDSTLSTEQLAKSVLSDFLPAG